MHELSLAEAMIEQLAGIARDQGFARIESIRVEIGAMSGVEREPFAFAFPIVAEGTLAEGAALEFVEVAVCVSCHTCGAKTFPEVPMILCGACHSGDVSVCAGGEFRILSMEVC
ncbi:MAG: hydrogenase maturation nickel metallochaperone HypA [Myxococcales bacterium]|jgi:hydrogenase nickel incorporation protein HypA/HybF|nr:hydrogenase maturation nickel metallochaperone HypA [Myxococcales bacterium]